MIHVYGIKNCDSVKKALKFLKAHALEYRFYDFKTDSFECHRLEQWLHHVELAKLFNTRSTTYRNLQLKELNLNNDEIKQWLCKEPLLIKRPVIEYDGGVLVGFNVALYEGELL